MFKNHRSIFLGNFMWFTTHKNVTLTKTRWVEACPVPKSFATGTATKHRFFQGSFSKNASQNRSLRWYEVFHFEKLDFEDFQLCKVATFRNRFEVSRFWRQSRTVGARKWCHFPGPDLVGHETRQFDRSCFEIPFENVSSFWARDEKNEFFATFVYTASWWVKLAVL